MKKKETAIFGAGCFWHVQETFDKVIGVLETEVGYMGGDEKKYPNPVYEQVCSDKTRYAEVVKIEYDSDLVSYGKLLKVFWNEHDPTSLNRQGNDAGSQYKSVIFYNNEKQRQEAENSRDKLQKRLRKNIVTEIRRVGKFFRAEEYHQKYLEKKSD